MRGAALLLVLWLVALLTALVGTFALAARTEHLQGQVLSRGVVAQQAARAGIEYAITRVGNQDPRWRWLADGREYRWNYAGAQVEIRIVDEQGKVDLNMADAGLLASLLRVVGSEPQQAARLAAAILDWRDADSLTQPAGGAEDADYAAAGRAYGAADAPLESVAEVEQVLGMTPALYARLAPHVTVYSGRERPDPAFASAEVLSAMGFDATRVLAQRRAWTPGTGRPPPLLPDGQPLVGADSGTYSIDSRARLPGRTAVLRVVVRSGGNGLPGSAWTALRGEEGASSR
jgi:general secretion pathway protein K